MKTDIALSLLAQLNNKALKVKHLSAPSYVDYLSLKRSLTKHHEKIAELEQSLVNEYSEQGIEVDLSGGMIRCQDQSFWEKLRAIRSEEFTHDRLNTIPMAEFKAWVDECSVGESDILAEYLLQR